MGHIIGTTPLSLRAVRCAKVDVAGVAECAPNRWSLATSSVSFSACPLFRTIPIIMALPSLSLKVRNWHGIYVNYLIWIRDSPPAPDGSPDPPSSPYAPTPHPCAFHCASRPCSLDARPLGRPRCELRSRLWVSVLSIINTVCMFLILIGPSQSWRVVAHALRLWCACGPCFTREAC